MKFSEMQYIRPDFEAVRATITAYTAQLKGAADFAAADAAFLGMQAVESALLTADAISYVRHTIDTRDEFYEGEASSAFCQPCSDSFSRGICSASSRTSPS